MRDPEMCFELGLAGGTAPRPLLLAQRLRRRRAVVSLHRRRPLRLPLLELHRQHEHFAKLWDKNLRIAGLCSKPSRTSRFAANPLPSERIRQLRPLSFHPRSATARKEPVIMNTTITNATIPRTLPLAMLTESTTNPRRIFEDAALQGTCREHPHARAFSLPCSSGPTEPELRNRLRGAAFPRRADCRGKKPFPSESSTSPTPQVLEAQLVENLQRRDVHPLEEARASKRFSTWRSRSTASSRLRRRLARPPAYVATRLKLTELVRGRRRGVLPRGDRRRTCAAAGEVASPTSRKKLLRLASARTGVHRATARPNASFSPSAVCNLD